MDVVDENGMHVDAATKNVNVYTMPSNGEIFGVSNINEGSLYTLEHCSCRTGDTLNLGAVRSRVQQPGHFLVGE